MCIYVSQVWKLYGFWLLIHILYSFAEVTTKHRRVVLVLTCNVDKINKVNFNPAFLSFISFQNT